MSDLREYGLVPLSELERELARAARGIPLRKRDGTVRAFAMVDADDFDRAAKHRWCLHATGYATRGERQPDGSTKTYWLARELLGADPAERVDHINRDRLDNRRENLRVVTHAQNCQNRSLNRNNKSGVRGVHWCARTGKWCAWGRVNKTRRFLGYYADLDRAAAVVSDFRAAHMPFSND